MAVNILQANTISDILALYKNTCNTKPMQPQAACMATLHNKPATLRDNKTNVSSPAINQMPAVYMIQARQCRYEGRAPVVWCVLALGATFSVVRAQHTTVC